MASTFIIGLCSFFSREQNGVLCGFCFIIVSFYFIGGFMVAIHTLKAANSADPKKSQNVSVLFFFMFDAHLANSCYL